MGAGAASVVAVVLLLAEPVVSPTAIPAGVEETTSAAGAPTPDEARLRALQAAAARAELQLKELRAARAQERRIAHLRERARALDPEQRLRRNAEQQAGQLMRDASAFRARDRIAAACEQYALVLRLYPETTWSVVARRSLKQLNCQAGEVS